MLRDIKRKNERKLMRKKGVIGVGLGKKESQGVQTEDDAIVVLVRKKKPEKQLLSGDKVPKTVNGVKTDVVEVGDIVALNPKLKHRPAPGGVSIGHYAITAGTFGCLVTGYDQKKYILSNNHVLANSNAAQIGDPIWQPGAHDGGGPDDAIAQLAAFVPIHFAGSDPDPTPPPGEPPPDDDDGWCPIANIFKNALNFAARTVGSRFRVETVRTQAELNYVDAALAFPLDPNSVLPEIMNIGNVAGVDVDYRPNKFIKKMGRTTGYTEDVIRFTDMSVTVGYGTGKYAAFTDQLVAGAMSAGGDSGSLVLTAENKAIGLLFAGSESTTIINPIHRVIDALGISF